MIWCYIHWTSCLQVVVTLSLSYMVGTIASFHNTTAVVITMGVTLAISLAIIAFSAQVSRAENVSCINLNHDDRSVMCRLFSCLMYQFWSYGTQTFSVILQTRYDFTIFYGILLILAMDLIMFGFFCTFYYSYITDIAYGCLGALLYSLVWERTTTNTMIILLLSKGLYRHLNWTSLIIKQKEHIHTGYRHFCYPDFLLATIYTWPLRVV